VEVPAEAIDQIQRLCGLITRYADRDGCCPRFILRQAYAAELGDTKIYKTIPHARGSDFGGKFSSWGRMSSLILGKHLAFLERAGAIKRDSQVITVVDWTVLLTVMQGEG
jgi:hypothetical protein